MTITDCRAPKVCRLAGIQTRGCKGACTYEGAHRTISAVAKNYVQELKKSFEGSQNPPSQVIVNEKVHRITSELAFLAYWMLSEVVGL